MKRFLLGWCALLMMVGASWADLAIDSKHRVENVSPGYCSWASIETLARHHDIKPLIGLVQHRVKNKLANGGDNQEIMKVLNAAKVDYTMRVIRDYKMLIKACDDGRGAVVNFYNYPDKDGYHAVTLVHIDEEEVRFIDSNKPAKEIRRTREWFDNHWDGYGLAFNIKVAPAKKVVVKKEEPEPVKPVPVTRTNHMDVMNVLRHTMSEAEARRLRALLAGE